MDYKNIKNISIGLFLSLSVGMGAAAMPLTIEETAVYTGTNFTMAGATPPTAADLGALNGDTLGITGSLAPNEVVWYSFMADGFTYLDITTNGSVFNTEIGLYDTAGNLVGNDDNDGFGTSSFVSFGAGNGVQQGIAGFSDAFGDTFSDGRDGPLAEGLYYLAIGEFNADFNATGFNVVSTGFDFGGEYVLNIFTDASIASPMSEPSMLLLIGLGLVGIGFARRT